MLQWARENGCPWSDEILTDAAMCGHLNVFQWALHHALEHGFFWDCRHDTLLRYSPNIIEWMKGHYVLSKKVFPYDDDDEDDYNVDDDDVLDDDDDDVFVDDDDE